MELYLVPAAWNVPCRNWPWPDQHKILWWCHCLVTEFPAADEVW